MTEPNTTANPFVPPAYADPAHAPPASVTKPFEAQAAYNELNARLIVAEARIRGMRDQLERLCDEAKRHLWHLPGTDSL